jgi:hypothetical protein
VVTGQTTIYVPPTTTSGKRGERHFCGTSSPPIASVSDERLAAQASVVRTSSATRTRCRSQRTSRRRCLTSSRR